MPYVCVPHLNVRTPSLHNVHADHVCGTFHTRAVETQVDTEANEDGNAHTHEHGLSKDARDSQRNPRRQLLIKVVHPLQERVRTIEAILEEKADKASVELKDELKSISTELASMIHEAPLVVSSECSPSGCNAGTRELQVTRVGSAKARVGRTVQALSDATSEAAERAKVLGHVAATGVRSKASELGTNAKALALNPAAQATSAGAASGSIAIGAAGGGLGLLAGGTAGAAVGLAPALFTFGLSIPICAAIGGGAGACLGTAAGGTTGLVGGGAVGYGAYSAFSKREEISKDASETLIELSGMAQSVKERAKERANMPTSSGTGGTQ
eukprot:CAMPEP_0172790360 /NCGR_PEP_ID=MMETSP1074-20121228/207926_1 /TAXON_ID=2916 /ORGANISM="Ceratium fusus, Strain PA161109" /LENGTH=326 /DNA_ID=CAMNT_0013627407 /DNA_START=70 /DNA_END=1050 /DNA_ORIENTATION=-